MYKSCLLLLSFVFDYGRSKFYPFLFQISRKVKNFRIKSPPETRKHLRCTPKFVTPSLFSFKFIQNKFFFAFPSFLVSFSHLYPPLTTTTTTAATCLLRNLLYHHLKKHLVHNLQVQVKLVHNQCRYRKYHLLSRRPISKVQCPW